MFEDRCSARVGVDDSTATWRIAGRWADGASAATACSLSASFGAGARVPLNAADNQRAIAAIAEINPARVCGRRLVI